MKNISYLLLLLGLVVAAAAAEEEEDEGSDDYKELISDVMQNGRLLLSRLEHCLRPGGALHPFTQYTSEGLQLFLGAMGVAYARHFPMSSIFLQTFRSTGWPVLRQAVGQVWGRYSRAASSLRRSGVAGVPGKWLEKSEEQLQELAPALVEYMHRPEVADKVEEIRRQYSELESLPEEEAAQAKLQLQAEFQRVCTVLDSRALLAEAVDPDQLEQVVSGCWAGMVACAATMTGSLATVTQGLTLGSFTSSAVNTIGARVEGWLNRTKSSFEEISQTATKRLARGRWWQFGAKAVVNTVTVALAFQLNMIVTALSTTVLAANLLVETGSQMLQRLADVTVPEEYKPAVLWTLAGVGLWKQFRNVGGSLSCLEWIMLSPLLSIEKLMKLTVATLFTKQRVGMM